MESNSVKAGVSTTFKYFQRSDDLSRERFANVRYQQDISRNVPLTNLNID